MIGEMVKVVLQITTRPFLLYVEREGDEQSPLEVILFYMSSSNCVAIFSMRGTTRALPMMK